jgi:hypothetical protein
LFVPKQFSMTPACFHDQIGQRGLSAAVGTTFFSLLQSPLYEYPDEWLRAIESLTLARG